MSATWHSTATACGTGAGRRGRAPGHLATFLLAARAAGSTVPFGRLAPLMLLALPAMALPVNIGGWGPREASPPGRSVPPG